KMETGPVKLCVQEIIKLDLQILALIQDIKKCNGPLEALEGFNLEASQKIQNLKNRIQDLERLAKEQDKETDKIAIIKDAENYKKQLTSTHQSLRRANIACQIAIEKKEKEQLFDGGTQARRRLRSNKETIAKTTSNITESLMAVSRTLSEEVQRSDHTMSTLIQSSDQVKETNEEFKGMTGHIQISSKLLTKYNRREITDKFLIFLALVFFFATVLYIVKKRVWPT
ncbi:unnamed protein product, partial [Owenia fusiformis]